MRGANVLRVKQDARFFAYLLLAALAVYAFGRCDGRAVTEMDWHERNVAKVAAHVRVQRKALAQAIAAKDVTRGVIIRRSDALDHAQTATDEQLLIAEDAIKDSAATIHTLRTRLGEVVAAVRFQQILTDSLQAAIVRDASAHLAERAAFNAVIAAQDAVISAQRKHIKALDCRVLGMRCPSRLQSFGIGGIVVAVLVLL